MNDERRTDRLAAHSSLILHPSSSFIVHRSSFIVHRSSFIVHRSSFIVHRSSFIVHRSSFIVHRSSFIADARAPSAAPPAVVPRFSRTIGTACADLLCLVALGRA